MQYNSEWCTLQYHTLYSTPYCTLCIQFHTASKSTFIHSSVTFTVHELHHSNHCPGWVQRRSCGALSHWRSHHQHLGLLRPLSRGSNPTHSYSSRRQDTDFSEILCHFVVTLNHRLLLLKLDKKTQSHLVVEVCIQQTRHMYWYPTPPSPMPCSLQELAGRWCHLFVCLVLTIGVYALTFHNSMQWTKGKGSFTLRQKYSVFALG